MLKTGEKVYCKSLERNFVIAKREGEYACTVIDLNKTNNDKFDSLVLSNHDLELGWK